MCYRRCRFSNKHRAGASWYKGQSIKTNFEKTNIVATAEKERKDIMDEKNCQETKVIYHIDDETTPYLVKIALPSSQVTLKDFKMVLNKQSSNYKYFFKSMDADFGWVSQWFCRRVVQKWLYLLVTIALFQRCQGRNRRRFYHTSVLQWAGCIVGKSKIIIFLFCVPSFVKTDISYESSISVKFIIIISLC